LEQLYSFSIIKLSALVLTYFYTLKEIFCLSQLRLERCSPSGRVRDPVRSQLGPFNWSRLRLVCPGYCNSLCCALIPYKSGSDELVFVTQYTVGLEDQNYLNAESLRHEQPGFQETDLELVPVEPG
jgi:hypothetical protein